MKSNAPHLSRRKFGLVACGSACALMGLTAMAKASDTAHSNLHTLEDSLCVALREIGSPACLAAAKDLAAHASGSSDVTLHLRDAGITGDGAALIAGALAAVTQSEQSRLRSFSLSYNDIGDEGAISLAAALPATLGELGLVGCSIADKGADAVLQWAAKAQDLGLICIEGNQMSQATRDGFSQLRRISPGLAVYL